MAKKETTNFPLPDDVGNDFEQEDIILNFRPKIAFVQPPPEVGDEGDDIEPEIDLDADPLGEARQRTEDLIKGYEAANKLVDLAEKRIDNRIANAGGFKVQLDKVVDAHVIAAIKRHFPDKVDPTVIDYQDYKKCLKDLNNQSAPLSVSDADIQSAKSEPLRTNFGGLGRKPGQNRPEVNSPASSIKPLDLSAFQAAGVIALFALLLPMIKLQDTQAIAEHLVTAPHNPI